MDTTGSRAADPRPLTVRETAILEALLAVEFDGVVELRGQVPSVRVVGGCACGCPSVDFVAATGGSMPVSGWRRDAAHQVGLFVRDGILAGLDYTVFDDSPTPADWPRPSELVFSPEPLADSQ